MVFVGDFWQERRDDFAGRFAIAVGFEFDAEFCSIVFVLFEVMSGLLAERPSAAPTTKGPISRANRAPPRKLRESR